MNMIERDAQWHLEQAAIEQMYADQAARRGYYGSAEKHERQADKHRARAAELDRAARTDAA